MCEKGEGGKEKKKKKRKVGKGGLSFTVLNHLIFKEKKIFFLINCWSSVVASVVLPQLCNPPLSFFFFICGSKLCLFLPYHCIFFSLQIFGYNYVTDNTK